MKIRESTPDRYVRALQEFGSRARRTDNAFQEIVLSHYKTFGRTLPWRETRDPYAILVSEIMLQQTQVDRVVPKYEQFLHRFPTWQALAAAPQAAVLDAWIGLGYYRRARNLHLAAKKIFFERGNEAPRTHAELKGLPGVGPYTSAAVAAFAFDEPVVMIETNIRTVYLLAYFGDRETVADRELLPIVERTLYRADPRSWFYGLMDLGAVTKRLIKGVNKRSAHYAPQSPYSGSLRQVRAAILKLVTQRGKVSTRTLQSELLDRGLGRSTEKIGTALHQLCDEGFLVRERGSYRIAGSYPNECR